MKGNKEKSKLICVPVGTLQSPYSVLLFCLIYAINRQYYPANCTLFTSFQYLLSVYISLIIYKYSKFYELYIPL